MSNFLDDVLENVGEVRTPSKGFEYGTHEVIIGEAVATTKDTAKQKGAEIINITVFDEADNEKTATCTLWFHTEGGAKMGVSKVLGLLVHSVGEEKKDAVRELGKKLFGSLKTPAESRDVAVKLINDKLIGKKAFLVAEPAGKYPTTSFGDIWHYPAEPQGQRIAKSDDGELTEADLPSFEDGDV